MKTREDAADMNSALLRMSVILRPFAAHCLAESWSLTVPTAALYAIFRTFAASRRKRKTAYGSCGECAELFVGDGEHVLSALIDTPADVQGITFCSDGELTVDIEKHTLG